MRLDEAVGVITDTELIGAYRRDGIAARVNDMYSITRIDRDTLVDAVHDTRGRLVIAEDHRPEGGLGAAVIEVLVGKDTPPIRLAHLAVRIMSGSGTPTELLAAAAIDAPTPTAQRRSAGPT